ncbi:telomere-associated protein Tap [Streptomyces thermolilacinus]|uniref:Transcriptional regulator n=1 Tax=Streptomyces thermolilacinus SPC6 TaxID=1306406 RepID=A0A1D3DLM8_9ACTN|nr:helix-turn-helix transcriptional regulator [Streptomyces thermolilacinus]OEJ93222.1 transcriptional regulator [Streptomyces thermolilacinus SPC6]
MATQEELFAAVDALLEGEPQLPPPAERARLREAAGVTQARLAQALKSTTQTVKNWENGRSEPRPPRLQAYLRLLEGWAAKYPPEPTPAPTGQALVPGAQPPGPARATAAQASGATAQDTGPAQVAPVHALVPGAQDTAPAHAPAPAAQPAAPAPAVPPATGHPGTPTAPTAPTARRSAPRTLPASKGRAAAHAPQDVPDGRFTNGPLVVLDGDGTAYGVGGLVLDCPATTVPELVEWALADAGLGAPRLHRHGKDSDPLVVLTEQAAVRLGLPPRLEGPEARRSLRLPQDHPVVRQITRAKWQLTQRGFGPWPRVYRRAEAGRRQCVQLAVLSWDALDPRAWGDAATLPAPQLARVLGVYARRVLTPRGSTAVSGLELMTALRPPTRAVKDEATGAWVSGRNPGSLGEHGIDPAPPEAPAEHPVAQGWTDGFLDEEAYQWVRDPGLLSDDECLQPWAVGIDLNTAFLAASSRLAVGLDAPVEVDRPEFDKKVPGSWLVDLSHIELDPRLPSPFTPSGLRPEGPAWYATPTVAYAVELGYEVAPLKAFVRRETGPYLDPWHDRLRDAYAATLADIGVTKDLDETAFLARTALHQLLRQADPDAPGAVRELAAAQAAVLAGPDGLRAAIRDHQPTATALLHADPADLAALAGTDDDRLRSAVERHRMVAMALSAVKSTVKGGVGKLRERPQGRHYRDGERWPALDRPTWRPDIRAAVISKARVNMHRKMLNMAKATGRYPLAVLSDCVVYPSPGPSPRDFLPRTADGAPLPGVFRLGPSPGLAKHEGTQETAWAVDLMERRYNPARHIKGGDAVMEEGE